MSLHLVDSPVMGKKRHRRRRSSNTASPWGAVALVAMLAIAALGLGAYAVFRPSGVDPEAVREANEQIADERSAREAQEVVDRQAALDAKTTTLTVPTDRAVRVAVLGDSLAAGSYTTAPELGWAQLLGAGLGSNGPASLTVEAKAGQTVGDAMDRPIPSEQDLVVRGSGRTTGVSGQTLRYSRTPTASTSPL